MSRWRRCSRRWDPRTDRHGRPPGGAVSHDDDPPDFFDVVRKASEKVRKRRSFDAACRKAMAGAGRDEARSILVEQYRLHGEEPPGQPLLDVRLDHLRRPVTPLNTARDMVDTTTTLIGLAGGLKGLVGGHPDQDGPEWRTSDLHVTPDWHHTIPVDLVADAEDWLGDIPAGLATFRSVTTVSVTLQATGARDADGRIAVAYRDRRIGLVPESLAEPFWDAFGEDGGSLLEASTQALRSRDSDTGRWRIDLGIPRRVRRMPRFGDFGSGDDIGPE